MAERKVKETLKDDVIPFQVHPDDAKDKVFMAILRALLKLKNVPSSPKELANTIIQHNYTILGGQTPFATVSSRISQHFKRAASHNPPRKPLLVKHVHQSNIRKISYSIATIDQEEESPMNKEHEILTRTSNSSLEADENDEQDIAAAIAITKLAQQPIHPTTIEQEIHWKQEHTDSKANVVYSTDILSSEPTNTNVENKQETMTWTIKGHTFTLTRKWLGDLEFYELDSPSDIPNTKVSRFSSNSKPSYSYVNATQLRKAAIPVLGEGTFDSEDEKQEGRDVLVVSKGPFDTQGAWVPLDRARELVEEFEIESSPGLTKLLSDQPFNKDPLLQGKTQYDNTSVELFPIQKQVESSSNTKRHIRIAPSTEKPVNIANEPLQSLNMTAIQQIIMAIPHLVQNSTQSSILSKVLATYIQYLTTLNSSAIASSSSSMNALPPSPSTNSSNNSPIKEPVDNMLNADTSVLHTIQPTKPRMEITVIDNIAVCIAFLVKDDIEYRIMRRLDNSFINGTQLLIAGGIDTESERSMILSFEMNRVRMPNRQSVLFGTWIPNRRAQELAATCSIQHMLTSFLGDDVEHLFPSPLPSFIANNKRRSRKNSLTATEDTAAATRNHHLAALTLAALKNPVVISDPHKTEIDRMTTTIDKNMPLTHPSRTLKSTTEYTLKAPHLGYFENTYDDNGKHVVVIDKSVSTTVDLNFIKQDENDSSDVDIETMEEFEHEGDTDTDNDIEQVRKEMRRVRDAAIAAMELDDILKMNYAEHRRKSDGQVRNDRPKKKRKVFSETEDDEDHSIPYRAFDFQRKRPVGFISGGGKWSASTGNNNTFKSSKIKRSATWHGKMTPTSNHKKQQKTETTLKQNTTAIIQKPSTSKHKAIQAVITHTLVDENDEGDEIDIGGSDNDDDLR